MHTSVLREAVVEIDELPLVQSPMPLVQNTDTEVNRWQARTVAKVRSHLARGKARERTHSRKPATKTSEKMSAPGSVD